MARNLLLGILEDVLGKYVEGLTKEHLKVGVWSGKIELFDLKLKPSSLDELNLPIQVQCGYLKAIRVRIPWTQLESKPVIVEIDGIFLLAIPFDVNSLTSLQAKTLIEKKRLKHLNEIEITTFKSIQQQQQQQQQKQCVDENEKIQIQQKRATFIQQLTTKILDNLEINITNIHIRYEDEKISDPLHSFACGFTIQRISLSTTDLNWQKAFILRDAITKATTSINKLGTMESLSIYWNTQSCQLSSKMSFNSWKSYMELLIHNNEGRMKHEHVGGLEMEPMCYILRPETMFQVQLIHKEHNDNEIPKVDTMITSSQLSFHINDHQYSQFKGVSEKFGEMDRRKVMITHRPVLRPNASSAAAREWWKYAYRLVAGKSLTTKWNSFYMIHRCLLAQRIYIPYYKNVLIKKELLSSDTTTATTGADSFDNQIPEHILEIEHEIPLVTLIVFRQIVAYEAIKKLNELKSNKLLLKEYALQHNINYKDISSNYIPKNVNDTNSNGNGNDNGNGKNQKVNIDGGNKGGFFSRFFSKKSIESDVKVSSVRIRSQLNETIETVDNEIDADADADELLMQHIQEKIKEATDAALADAESLQAFTLRLHLRTSASIQIELNRSMIMNATMSMQACVEKRSQNIQALLELESASVIDLATRHPSESIIVRTIEEERVDDIIIKGKSLSLDIPRIKTAKSFESSRGDEECKIPQLCMSFQLKDGRTSLLVSAKPLQITWNERFINQTLKFINIKSPIEQLDASSNFMKRSPLLAASMHRFASEMALPTGYKDITLEIHAPKFIIPEDSEDSEAGCLILDCGKLIVNGELGPPGMTWDVSLKNVNVAMPSALKHVNSQVQDSSDYLVHPFRIAAELQTVNNEEAKMTFKVQILPHIDARVDAIKLIRLKYTLDVALRSLKTSENPSSNIQNTTTTTEFESRTLPQGIFHGDEADTTRDSGQALQPSILESDSEEKTLAVTILLPSVKLYLSVTESHHAELIFDLIEFNFVKRLMDSNFYFKVGSMELQDSARPESFRNMIMTNTNIAIDDFAANHGIASVERQLIRVHFRSISSPVSSLYEGFQTELNVFSAGLVISIDAESTMRYIPFIETLTKGMKARNEALGDSSISTNNTVRQKIRNKAATYRHTDENFGGTKLSCSVVRMSLCLLESNHPHDGGITNLTEGYAVELNDFNLRSEVSKKSKKAHAHVRSFTITDERITTENVVYKSLVSQNHQSSNDSSGATCDKILPMSSNDTDSRHLLAVEYIKEVGQIATVQVVIRNITTYVALDIALALVDKTLENIDAVKSLLSAANGDTTKSSQLNDIDEGVENRIVLDSYNDEDGNDIDQCMSVSVKMIDPRLVFLENPCNAHSKAFVSTCGINFSFLRSATKLEANQSFEIKDVIHLALTDAEVFVVTDLQMSVMPHKVIDPTELNIYLRKTTEKGVVLRNKINFHSSDIAARLSLNDIVLLQGIIARFQNYKQQTNNSTNSERKETATLQSQRTKAEEDEPDINPTVNEYYLDIPEVSIHLLNDYKDQNIPIGRLVAKNMNCTINGVANEMEGESSFLVYSDYYNTENHCWEPMIEDWICKATYKKNFNGALISIEDEQSIMVNLSGALFKCIYDALDLVEEIGKEGSYGTHRDFYPLKIKNELGAPVSLVDSSSKKVLLSLDGDAEYCVPSLNEELASSGRSVKLSDVPQLFDLVLRGDYVETHQPITQIPIVVSKFRKYTFQPSRSTLARLASLHAVSSEPILEEVFENSRYNTFTMEWGDPWPQLGDPSRWTNSRGRDTKRPQDIELPLNWSWVEPNWKVDKSGYAKKEVDAEGYEYATAFSAFTTANRKSRTQRPLDCVRRRRLVRTRAPFTAQISSGVNDSMKLSKSVTMFWKVSIAEDESRLIRLTSPMEFINNTTDDLEIKLLEGGESSGSTILNVPLNSERVCPVHVADSAYVCFRPSGCKVWSESIDCKIKTNESAKSFAKLERISCQSGARIFSATVYLELSTEGILRITCNPTAQFFNRLPCPCSVKCTNINNYFEKLDLEAGESKQLMQINGTDISVRWHLTVGNYTISTKLPIEEIVRDIGNTKTQRMREYDVKLSRRDSTALSLSTHSEKSGRMSLISGASSRKIFSHDEMLLTVRFIATKKGSLNIVLYSKFLCIDKSQSGISLRTIYSTNASELIGVTDSALNFERSTIGNNAEAIKRNTDATQTSEEFSSSTLQYQWTEGGGGVVMFQGDPSKQTISIGVNGGRGWIHDLALDSLGPHKTPFEIVEENSLTTHYLSLTVTNMEHSFSATRMLTVMPSIVIINHLDEEINLLHPTNRKSDINKTFAIDPKSSRNFIRPNTFPGSLVRISSERSMSSLGKVDLNEVGTTLLMLPWRGQSQGNSSTNTNCMVLHVEVKLAPPEDSAYIYVLIWRADVSHATSRLTTSQSIPSAVNSSAHISIRNDSELPFLVRQGGITASNLMEYAGSQHLFDLNVEPGQWVPFGWVDQEVSQVVHISCDDAGSSSELTSYSAVSVMEQVGKFLNIPTKKFPQYKNQLKVYVETYGNGLLLRIAHECSKNEIGVDTVEKLPINSFSTDVRLLLRLRGVVLSLVAEGPKRREFLTIYIDRIRASCLLQKGSVESKDDEKQLAELEIMDIQVDNYAEAIVYPVLANSFHGAERKQAEIETRKQMRRADSSSKSSAASTSSEDDVPPFFIFYLHRQVPQNCNTAIIKRVALRILEINLAIDSSSIILFFCDIYSDLRRKAKDVEITECVNSVESISDFNTMTLSDHKIDIDQVYRHHVDARKLFIEALEVHPIKLTITYVVSTFPRDLQSELQRIPGKRWLSSLQRIAAIERFELKINSLLVNNAFQSSESVLMIIVSKIRNELRGKVAQLAGGVFGSLQVLGKPANLYRKLGTGVQDFFYEPYLGAMESPSSFMIGVGKGASSLVTGVASGLIGSTATILGSATSGVSSVAKGMISFSGDDKFMKERDERRRMQRSGQGGILSGLKSGGENFISGVSSGFTGLVTNPYDQGKKEGALGFVKGVGMGLVGVAVKPVLGVSDGITSVAEGFSQQVADESISRRHVRAARAFDRAEHDFDALVLTKLNIFASLSQQLVRDRSRTGSYKDEYVGSCVLGFPPQQQSIKTSGTSSKGSSKYAFGIVVSLKYVLLLSNNLDIIWEIHFSNLSHIDFIVSSEGVYSIDYVLYEATPTKSGGTGNPSRYNVRCANKLYALNQYSLMAKCAHKMGNPSAIVPPSSLRSGEVKDTTLSSRTISRRIAGGNTSSDKLNNTEDSDKFKGMDQIYQFGNANTKTIFPYQSGDNKTIIERARSRFIAVPYEHNDSEVIDSESSGVDHYYKMIDELLWHLISDWKDNHNYVFNPSRCSATLIINECRTNYVQLTGKVELKEGVDVVLFPVGTGYDADSLTLKSSGGAVVVFAYGAIPTLVDLAHVKLKIYSNAFTATISTRKQGSICRQKDGWHAAFVEKTTTDYWAKNVMIINDAEGI